MKKLEYICLINKEGQYSLWSAHTKIPLGWKQEGESGSKEECLQYIKRVWTDMRPINLRIKMDILKI